MFENIPRFISYRVKNTRYSCIRCGRCCKLNEIILSNREMHAISHYLNIPTIQEFKDTYLTKKKIHKLRTFSSNMFEIEGEAFILKKNELNLCPFYSEIDQQASCKIYKFRPIVCRLFPYTWETSEYNPTPVKMAIDFSQNGWDGCPGINHQNGKYWDDLRDEVTGAVLLSIIQSNELITDGYLNQVPR